MTIKQKSGLGELLRHLNELVDSGASVIYEQEGLSYRPRYTPIMRCISRRSSTVTEITEAVNITQGAVSQTIKLMESDELIVRKVATDTRSSTLSLTAKGLELLNYLEQHWQNTFDAIQQLEKEIGHPVLEVLEASINALEMKSFSERILVESQKNTNE